MSSAAPGSSGPIAWILPSSIARSARSTPSGVTSIPPRRTRSAIYSLHVIEEAQTRLESGRNVFGKHRLIRMMADTARTPQEQHRRGHPPGHDHGVMTGAAMHSMLRVATFLDSARQRFDQPRIHRHGRLIETKFRRDPKAAPPRDLTGAFEQTRHRSYAHIVAGMADVETHTGGTGDDIDRSGPRLDPSDVPDQAPSPPTFPPASPLPTPTP